MARHKRRRSEPTRDRPPAEREAQPGGSAHGKEDAQFPHGAPPTARPSSRAPPTEPPAPGKGDGGGGKDGGKAGQGESIDPENRARLDRLFWMRVGVAVLAGTAATFIFEPIVGEERRWASIGFMIVVFIGTAVAGKMMGIRLPRSDRKKIVTQGIGSYIFLYLFMWIVSYTLVNIQEAEVIASPIP